MAREKTDLFQKSSETNFIVSNDKLKVSEDEKVSDKPLKNHENPGRSVGCEFVIQPDEICHTFKSFDNCIPEHYHLHAVMRRRAVIPLPKVTTIKTVVNGHTHEIFHIKALGHECPLLAESCDHD